MYTYKYFIFYYCLNGRLQSTKSGGFPENQHDSFTGPYIVQILYSKVKVFMNTYVLKQYFIPIFEKYICKMRA